MKCIVVHEKLKVKFIKAQETYAIRKEILRKNIDLPYKFDGDFDTFSFHLGVFANLKLVSIASFVSREREELNGAQFQLRGMATIKPYRNMGCGKMLLERAEDILLRKNIHIIWCNARLEAVQFYSLLKYKELGSVFEVSKIGLHKVLYKEF